MKEPIDKHVNLQMIQFLTFYFFAIGTKFIPILKLEHGTFYHPLSKFLSPGS
jgi:hypothetical protein